MTAPLSLLLTRWRRDGGDEAKRIAYKRRFFLSRSQLRRRKSLRARQRRSASDDRPWILPIRPIQNQEVT